MAIEKSQTRIGWVGTGVMGGAMAMNLIRAGWQLTVTNRTKAKARPLLEAGAIWESTPMRVAMRSDVVFTMVGYPADVEQVILAPDGILAGLNRRPSDQVPMVIDMTTSSPALARTIYERAVNGGIDALDAPVSGGDVGARNGTLSIMVGGDELVYELAKPLFQDLGKTIVYHGSAGSGQHAKMVNQILIAGTMAGMAEALLYAFRFGLDPDRVLASVSTGAAGSWSLSNLAPRVLRGDFAPGFYVEHFIKDMGIALEEAGRAGLKLPILAETCALYKQLMAQGSAREGTQAIVKAVARYNRLEWKNLINGWQLSKVDKLKLPETISTEEDSQDENNSKE